MKKREAACLDISILSEVKPMVRVFLSSFPSAIKIVAGTYMTTAAWIRNFVRTHPRYCFDSIIDEQVGYDLMVAVDKM
jgi:hypothetical protein